MFDELFKKLFPLRGKKLNETLQAMFAEARSLASQGKHKQALEAYVAVLDESVNSTDWTYNRTNFVIPAIITLAESYEPARFKARSLKDQRERLMLDGKADATQVREWCLLTQASEPDRILFFYDDLKRKRSDNPVLKLITSQQSELFVSNGRYAEFSEDDLDLWFCFLEDDAYDVETARKSAAEKGSPSADDDEDVGVDDDDDDEADDEEEDDDDDELSYDECVEALELEAVKLFQVSLGLGNEEFAEKTYKVFIDTLPAARSFHLLIVAAEKILNEKWNARLLQDAQARLSTDEFAALSTLRGAGSQI